MKVKTIISATILSLFVAFSCFAQEVNKFEKFQHRLAKGTSTLSVNINCFEHSETKQGMGLFIGPSFTYSYFMLNRFSINASVSYSQSFGKPYREKESWLFSEKSIDLSFRYYFFKRGGLFIDAGGSFGHILVDMPDDYGRKFYAAPKIAIGYSYMISNMWKKIDNKVSVNFSIGSYIPYKRRANYDICDWLLYFPVCKIELGVVYYFLRK